MVRVEKRFFDWPDILNALDLLNKIRIQAGDTHLEGTQYVCKYMNILVYDFRVFIQNNFE